MLRRPPTRVELKLDDLNEYDAMKRALEDEKKKKKENNGGGGEGSNAKSRAEIVQQRIGYDPSSKGNGKP